MAAEWVLFLCKVCNGWEEAAPETAVVCPLDGTLMDMYERPNDEQA